MSVFNDTDVVDGHVTMGDDDLIAWLEEIQLDQSSIQRVCTLTKVDDPIYYRTANSEIEEFLYSGMISRKCPE